VSAETVAPGDLPLKENVAANTRRITADTTQQAGRVLQQQSRQTDIAASTPVQPAAAPAEGTSAGTAEPVGGWQAFENYLSKNTKREERRMKASAGVREVELQFEVDQAGRPVNINVLQSNCIACHEEAIRLLKEGPSWKGKTGRVKIAVSL
jgi:outer membrane biosynthesis protein TonB